MIKAYKNDFYIISVPDSTPFTTEAPSLSWVTLEELETGQLMQRTFGFSSDDKSFEGAREACELQAGRTRLAVLEPYFGSTIATYMSLTFKPYHWIDATRIQGTGDKAFLII